MAFQGVGQAYAGGVDGNVHVMLVLSLNVRVLPVILEHSVRKASTATGGALTSAHYYLKLILTEVIADVIVIF